MGSLESGTEWVGGELTKGVGKAGKELLKATGKKEIKSQALKALASYGLDIGENFFEEAIMEPLEEVVTQATGGKADYSNIKARMLQSGIDGALTSIIMGGASAGIGSAVGVMTKAENGEQISQEDIKKALVDINKSEEVDIEKLLVDNFNFNPEDFVDIKEVNQARDAKMEKIAGELTTDERMKIINGSNLDDRQKESLSEIAEKYQLTADEIQNAINKTLNGEYTQNQEATMQNNEVLSGEQQITQAEGKTSQNETSSEIEDKGLNLAKSIDNFNKSVQENEKIFDLNDEKTKKEIEGLQKIANEGNVSIEIDRTPFEKNGVKDTKTNAFYEYDKDGKLARVVLNPHTNTKKYVQNLVMHEMYHSFTNQNKEGKDLKLKDKLRNTIIDNAQRKTEFEDSMNDLYNTYGKTYASQLLGKNVQDVEIIQERDGESFIGKVTFEDGTTQDLRKDKKFNNQMYDMIEEEAVANILGEKLGNQEFVEELVNGKYKAENRSLVEKIYDFVKNQINRFTGYKDQEQYWKHVKELFDNAYRNSEKNQGQNFSKEATAMTNITDSQGRNLSQGQVDYFKDSKVRDENGNLIPVYHGTANDFTIFNKDFQIEGDFGKGFYFTDSKGYAEQSADMAQVNKDISQYKFGEKNGKVLETYLNIKNPVIWKNYTDYQKYKDIAKQEGKTVEEYLRENYDGIIVEKPNYDGEPFDNAKFYVAFEPNQIKNVDNVNPTESNDIRYSKEDTSNNVEEDEWQRKINKSMTMEQAKDMIERAFVTGNIKEWFDGEYKNGDEWLAGEGASEVALIIDNDYNLQNKYVNSNEDILNEEYTIDDVIEAYQNGTLTGSSDKQTQRLDTSNSTGYTDESFYAPKDINTDTELYNKANQRVTSKNRQEVYKARADFIINAHNEGYIESLGLTQKEVNEKLRNWSAYPKSAMETSKSINEGVAKENRWTGIENCSIVNELSVTPEQLDSMVKEVKGVSNDYQRRYISNTMLAIDTHMNFKNLTFDFAPDASTMKDSVLGDYQPDYDRIRIKRDGQNTVSHEMTHYLDHLIGRELADGYNLGVTRLCRSNINNFERVTFTAEQKQFLTNFANFLDDIENSADIGSSYKMSSDEVFARFGARFTEWTRNVATGNRYGYEAKWYNDNFNTSQFKEFAKLLQEYSLLKTTNQASGRSVTIANLNLNESNNIQYSKDTTGAWNNFIEKYFKNEGTGTAIKDMKKLPVKTYSMQDIDNVLNETTLSDELKEEFRNDLKGKTITKEIFNEYKDAIKQVEKDYENYNAERKPSWDDIGEVFEQPSEEVESPLQDRDIETIGKETKKNAYQYENPEVKPYFQEMAQMIGEDLAYASDPINRRTKKGGGTVLQANTKAINDLHNKYGYSYEQIGIGLNNIIEDNGAENNAVSKKIEFYIDDALRNGYRNIQGQYIQPNQDYINTIQYSMETENQAEKIEEEKPKPKVLNPTQISNLTLEDVSTTPKLPNKKYKEGSKVSSFVSNIENDVGFLNEEEKQELLKDDNVKYYAEITNADTLAKAYDNLKENGKDATLKWYTKPTANATAEDVATGWILLKQYSDKGDTEGMVNVAKKLRDMGTKAGQTVQAFNILSRLTPEGMVAYTQGELQDAYNEMIKGKSKKWIDQHKSDFDLSQDEIAFIMDTMQNLPAEDPSNNNYDRKVALGQIQKLFTDKIPSENNKIKAWMRISMLFNPKTQVRNVTGNAGVVPVNMASDFLGSKVDKILSKYTGVRTLGNPNAKAYLKGMKEGFYQSYNDFKLGINTRDIEQNKFEFGQGKAFKDKGIGKALNRVDNMLNFIMDFGDRGFSQASFVNSLNNQMLLNGVTTPTQDMIDIATQEALSRTWNDNNEYTKFVLGVRRALNKVGTKNYGLGDVLIPFAKTPANLTKAIVEYSPVGLTKQILNIKDIKNAIETGQFTSQQQHEFADKMGKGLAGTLLYIAGYALAQAGIATGEPDEDKDVKNFMKNSLGIAPYSIKIGDKSFTYDWAQPVATPLAIMTNLYQTNKNNPDATMLDKIMSATNIGTNQLMEQSFMESLNEVLNGNGEITDRIQKAILDLPARAIPTFSKQIADMVDGTQRTSFEYGQPVKSAINSAKAKLPFVSKELTPVVDTLGNEVEKYGGENNWFNVFFNPANMNKGKKTKAGEEIYNVYQETGDTTIFPVTAPYYVNQDGAKITMDSKQRAEYQKTAGDYTEETVNKLINDSDYQKLDDPEKAEILSQVVKDSNEKAKRDVLNINNKSSDLELIDKVGADYYTYKIATKGMSKQGEKCEALEKKDYSNQNKQLIYESEINKEDKTFEGLKKINKNFNMDEYLKYKSQNFSGDNKKEDTINYVNGLDLDGIERLYIIGRTYKLNKTEKQQLETLLRNKMPSQEMLDVLQTIK